MAWFLILWMVGVGGAVFLLLLGAALQRELWRWTYSAGAEVPPLVTVALVSVSAAALLGVVYLGWAAGQPELKVVRLFGARRPAQSEYNETRQALADISLAAGLKPPPGLFITPLPRNVNAVVVGRAPASAIVIVTEGMATRVPVSLQRAVFASLLGRFRNGGVGWTTLLYSLVWPMELFAEQVRSAFRDLVDDEGSTLLRMILGLVAVAGLPLVTLLSVSAFFWLVGFIRLFSASFQGAYRSLARSADADGMMLLKHPENAACALKTILPEDNWIPFGGRLNYLAYVRGDYAFEIGSEERDRLAQLTSLVGEATIDTVRLAPLPSAVPDVENPVMARADDPEVQERRARLRAQREESAART